MIFFSTQNDRQKKTQVYVITKNVHFISEQGYHKISMFSLCTYPSTKGTHLNNTVNLMDYRYEEKYLLKVKRLQIHTSVPKCLTNNITILFL